MASNTPVVAMSPAESSAGDDARAWPKRPEEFPDLMTPVEACQYLRLDETDRHTPVSAVRTLKYFRDRGWLKATKFVRQVWYRKIELDKFLENKTES